MSCSECHPPSVQDTNADDPVEEQQQEEQDEDSVWEAWMQRGSHLRKLRELEQQDELERQQQQQQQQQQSEQLQDDKADDATLAVVLDYDAYLQSQRYYDDLKHVDYRYIDFGRPMMMMMNTMIRSDEFRDEDDHHHHDGDNNDHSGILIVEQDKTLGKGGFCWDAAHILGDYLVALQESLLIRDNNNHDNCTTTTVIELGCGTGGMMLAKSCPVKVTLTDLPCLMPLIERNLARNFALSTSSLSCSPVDDNNNSSDDDALHQYLCRKYGSGTSRDGVDSDLCLFRSSRGQVEARVLEWSEEEDKDNNSESTITATFDVIVASDVVASIYNPTALARTMHRLAHAHSSVYVSFKERLSTVHRQFEEELADLFGSIELIAQPAAKTRNRNPQVQILVAREKKRPISS